MVGVRKNEDHITSLFTENSVGFDVASPYTNLFTVQNNFYSINLDTNLTIFKKHLQYFDRLTIITVLFFRTVFILATNI